MTKTAYIEIVSEDYDDLVKSIVVLKDDRQVLYCDVHEGGICMLEDYVDDTSEYTAGFYSVNYDYHLEAESWEMPNIEYPVIDTFHLRKCWWARVFAILNYIKRGR